MGRKKADTEREVEWMHAILQVRSGQRTVSDAAKKLGVSRKTYYKRENRALQAMLEALRNRPSGRPSQLIDGRTESLEKTIKSMQKEMERMEQRAYIRDCFDEDIPALRELMNQRSGKKKPDDQTGR